MGAVDTTYTFTATDTITSTKMNNIIDQTTITPDAIIGTTLDVASGKLKIRSAGITSNEMGNNSIVTDSITDANVTTVKIADSNVTTAKIADANVTPSKLSQPLTLETAKTTTSGTSIDFTNIPAWAKRVTVMFNGVSTNGVSPVQVRLGISSGVVSTGYDTRVFTWTGGPQGSSSTSGFLVDSSNSSPNAGAVRQGNVVFTKITDNTWSGTGNVSWTTLNGTMSSIAGSISLSATLDRVRITTVNGTDTFDVGTVNIMYE